MRREQLEHVIRAAAAITNQYELVVIGSQAVLGAFPNAPDLADLIDGAIGEGSPFEDRFGYYGQGVGPSTAVLPRGWEERLVKVQGPGTDLKIGWCLDPHDLAVSKLVAGREKDWPFVEALLRHRLVQPDVLIERLGMLDDTRRVDALTRWVHARAPAS
jgi:hypothetical protein